MQQQQPETWQARWGRRALVGASRAAPHWREIGGGTAATLSLALYPWLTVLVLVVFGYVWYTRVRGSYHRERARRVIDCFELPCLGGEPDAFDAPSFPQGSGDDPSLYVQ